MITSISNWFTNQQIVWIAVCMACLGFVGPGLFGLSPPKYFDHNSSVSGYVDSAQDSSAPSTTLADKSVGSALSKMGEPPKELTTARSSFDLNAEDADQKRQTDKSATVKKNNVITEPENAANSDIAQSLKAVKPPASTVAVVPVLVPRELIARIPASHPSLPVVAQKESFIKIVLPLILAGNEEILRRRDAIRRANQSDDRANLEKWARLYDIKPIDQDNSRLTRQLLSRADVIPVPIALAQAAVESGWGTSRFAMQGNALFGQWAWRDDAGLRPLAPSNDRAVVRSFSTLLGSVRAYIHNLNTHPYYQDFRNTRAKLYDGPKEKKTKILVKYLDRYAQIGPAYVTKLENLIRTNNFGRFALAYLT